MKGNVFALAGNLTALARGERYIANDLNRIWQPDRIERARRKQYRPEEIVNEVEEQLELWAYIDELMQAKPGKFIFIDLHTTSVATIPFITMSDTLVNRSFANKIPVPAVLGIEAFLHEPMLGYVDDLGCTAMAFEAGQHDDPKAIQNHEAFIWLALAEAGILKKMEMPHFRKHQNLLRRAAKRNRKTYEIRSRRAILPGDFFKMISGFQNFDPVKKGSLLAYQNGDQITAPEDGSIFMPLYQNQGEDGFFIVKQLAKINLLLSFFLRKIYFHRALTLIPGVNRFMNTDHTMAVNKRIAGNYVQDILRFMGFRRTKKRGDLILFMRRKNDFPTCP